MRTSPGVTVPTVLLAAVLVVGSLTAPATAADPTVERIAGPERIATAAEVAGHFEGADVVHVATAHDFPDALAGGALAAAAGGPILLVTHDAVPEPTRAALERLEPAQIVVLGGQRAIADSVVTELGELADEVVRRGGADRFATAAEASTAAFPDGAGVVVLASGETFADALAAGAAAARMGAPVLLTARDGLPDTTRSELERLDPDDLIVLGGTAAISDAVAAAAADAAGAVVERLFGPERIATAVAVADAVFADGAPSALIAAAGDFPDALAAGPLAAKLGGPVLLADPECLSPSTDDAISRLRVEHLILVGGQRVLGPGVEALERCGPPPGPVELDITTITEDLAAPWSIDFLPDGDALITERDTGQVWRRAADGGLTLVRTLGVDNTGEGGLLGLTVSPGIADDGLVYAYLTTPAQGGSVNRVVRFGVDGGAVQVIVDAIPAGSNHNGGGLVFGPDGMLYISTGDAGDPARSQDADDLAGAVLRVRPDGTVPDDNPFDNEVWAIGLRNTQGLDFDADGRLFASEFGPNADDEINIIVRGGNYGWPHVTGAAGDEDFVDPILVKQPPEASWSGVVVLTGGAIPQWEGDLFVAALRGQRLWRVRTDDAGTVTQTEELLTELDPGRLRDVVQAPDGSLWVLTNNTDGRGSPREGDDRIIRIGPADS